MTDQAFSAEMQDDAQAFASEQAQEGRTHDTLMQGHQNLGCEKDRAETIAASVDAAALARIFAGDQNALERAVRKTRRSPWPTNSSMPAWLRAVRRPSRRQSRYAIDTPTAAAPMPPTYLL